MSATAMPRASTPAVSFGNLDRAGLLVPALQPMPFPIHRILPAPCTQACPAGIQVKAYVSLIAEERFAEALEVIRRRCPLPGICGRICHHPCELACRRGRADDPVAIRALKRFVADQERDFPLPAPPPGPDRPAPVAIVGSGPAGLTAAYDLRLAGYPVTVFEATGDPGGMLRHGITAYRLPRDILAQEIDVIVRAGVEIRTGTRLGRDIGLDELLSQGYRAVLLAVGAQFGRSLGVSDEEESPEVEDALAFLRRVNDLDHREVGRTVVVIGGGSTAVEAARSARRLGAERVEILYRRSEEELLAGPEEIRAAEAEGIKFRFLVTPVRAVRNGGRFVGLECVQVGLREADASGRRRPVEIGGTEFTVPCDKALAAVGQEVDLSFLPSRRRNRLLDDGRLIVDEATTLTRLTRVFAAGDMVTGPSTVIDAIAGGHRAAESIRHLLEEGRPGVREQRPEREAAAEYELPDPPPVEAKRIEPRSLRPRRGREFAEVEQPYEAEAAVAEARRCLRCGPCGECKICAPTCTRRHVMVRSRDTSGPGSTALLRVPASVALSLKARAATPGWVLPTARPGILPHQDISDGVEVDLLPVRSRIREELCRGCARCAEVCPFHAVAVEQRDGGDPVAVIERSLCRGCSLCTAVCSTHAAVPSALAPGWEEEQLAETVKSRPGSHVVLACQRRTGAMEAEAGVSAEIIRVRCVGRIEAGMLLELLRGGAGKVLVAGCASDRCRFGEGASLAARQVEIARGMLRILGEDEARIRTDWSASRAHDRLEAPIARLADTAELAEARETG